MTYLIVFGVSFLIRGTFDTFQNYRAVSNKVIDSIMMVVIYFGCEWLPIFVIYWHHRQDFSFELEKREIVERGRLNLMPSPP